MRRLAIVILFFAVGCVKETGPEIKYPERLPLTEQAKELTELPEYQAPVKGRAVGLQLDEPALFDGILLDEGKAMAAAKLRISYDEVYRLAIADRKYMLALIEIQEKALYRGDQIIDYKEMQLREIRDDWWEENKLQIGVAGGLVLGIGLTLLTGKVWAKIEEDQDGS